MSAACPAPVDRGAGHRQTRDRRGGTAEPAGFEMHQSAVGGGDCGAGRLVAALPAEAPMIQAMAVH